MTISDNNEANSADGQVVPHLPVVVLVDNSSEMLEDGKMAVANRLLLEIQTQILEASSEAGFADDSVEIAVVTFGQEVKVVHDFSNAKECETPDIEAEPKGNSLLFAALLKGMALIESRKYSYQKSSIGHRRPAIILILGSSNYDFNLESKWPARVFEEIKGDVEKEEVRLYPFIIRGNAVADSAERNKILDMIGPLCRTNYPRVVVSATGMNFDFQDLLDGDNLPASSKAAAQAGVSDGQPSTGAPLPDSSTPQRTEKPNPHRIIGASVIGPIHVTYGIPCEDAFDYETFDNGYSAIAIADGLGSKSKSEIGARVAVEAATRYIKNKLNASHSNQIDLESLARDSVVVSRHALEEKSSRLQCSLRDLACTLIVVVLKEDSVAIAHIGDGAVVMETDEGLGIASKPGDSEYANEVQPITGKGWDQALRTTLIPHVKGIIAFTDGCQRAALVTTKEGRIPHQGFCQPLLSYMTEGGDLTTGNQELKELLLSQKMADNSEDDKTLVVAVTTQEG